MIYPSFLNEIHLVQVLVQNVQLLKYHPCLNEIQLFLNNCKNHHLTKTNTPIGGTN